MATTTTTVLNNIINNSGIMGLEQLQVNYIKVLKTKFDDGLITASTLVSNLKSNVKPSIFSDYIDSGLGALSSELTGAGAGAVPDGSITEAKIGALAVTAAKIDTDAVIEAKIQNGAVTADKIGAGAVTASKLADEYGYGNQDLKTLIGTNSINSISPGEDKSITAALIWSWNWIGGRYMDVRVAEDPSFEIFNVQSTDAIYWAFGKHSLDYKKPTTSSLNKIYEIGSFAGTVSHAKLIERIYACAMDKVGQNNNPYDNNVEGGDGLSFAEFIACLGDVVNSDPWA